MIGIFGGTFDPVHFGHTGPALAVMRALQLSELRFVPNRVPPHRGEPWLTTEQRLALLKTAVEELPACFVDERELSREGPSYMVDTLRSLKQELPEQVLCLIIGMDALRGIHHWHHWRDILTYCHIVVTQRPGYPVDMQAAFGDDISADDVQFLTQKISHDSAQLIDEDGGRILLQSVPQLDISSTRIRECLRKNEDVSRWLAPQVYLQLRGFINDDR